MKPAAKYLMYAYLPIIAIVFYIIACVSLIGYGPNAEDGTLPIKCVPYLMLLSAAITLIASNIFLRIPFENGIVIKLLLLRVFKILPAIFLSCLQLYASLMFLGFI